MEENSLSVLFRDHSDEWNRKTEESVVEEKSFAEIDAAEDIFSDEDESYMKEALSLAQKAFDQEDTPIGAVLVYQGKVIGRGYNQRNALKNSLCHAEIEAINEGSGEIGDWRLEETTLYVTLEPCPMCAGAIVQARIPEVVIGTMNPKAGCAGSVLNLLQQPKLNHQVKIRKGLLQEECSGMMKQFFAQLRLKQKREKERLKAMEMDSLQIADSEEKKNGKTATDQEWKMEIQDEKE